MVEHLEHMLGATVQHAMVNSIDLVRDTTTVDVRYRLLDPDTPQTHLSAFEPQMELDVVERRGTTR